MEGTVFFCIDRLVCLLCEESFNSGGKFGRTSHTGSCKPDALLHAGAQWSWALSRPTATQCLTQDGNTVALLAEDLGSLGKAVGRQLLRTRRSFTATVFSPDGERCLPRNYSSHL